MSPYFSICSSFTLNLSLPLSSGLLCFRNVTRPCCLLSSVLSLQIRGAELVGPD
ncbi:hypothetical protein LEMLEM_LOCUS20343 [Lemmus lemmus]